MWYLYVNNSLYHFLPEQQKHEKMTGFRNKTCSSRRTKNFFLRVENIPLFFLDKEEVIIEKRGQTGSMGVRCSTIILTMYYIIFSRNMEMYRILNGKITLFLAKMLTAIRIFFAREVCENSWNIINPRPCFDKGVYYFADKKTQLSCQKRKHLYK